MPHDVVARLRRCPRGHPSPPIPALLEATREDRSGWRSASLPIAVVHATSVDQVQAVMRIAHATGTPVVPRGAGTGLAGGAIASPRCDRARPVAHEPHPRDLRRRRARGRRAGRAQRRPQRPARTARALVRARPREPCDLVDRRQHRHERRRPAVREVRRDPRGRARARGRARRRPPAAHGPPHREGRHRVRPHRAPHRVRGHPRRHRRGDRAAAADHAGRRRSPSRACSPTSSGAAAASAAVTAARLRPAVLELIDAAGLARVAAHLGDDATRRTRRSRRSRPGETFLLAQADGAGAADEAAAIAERFEAAGGRVSVSTDAAAGERLLGIRRAMHPALAASGNVLIEDVAVPRSRLPEMFRAIERSARGTASRSRRSRTPATATCTRTSCSRATRCRRTSGRPPTRCSAPPSSSAAR